MLHRRQHREVWTMRSRRDAQALIVNNGWEIYFHREFATQYADFIDRLTKLEAKLPSQEYASHATVKLFGHLIQILENVIPADPLAPYFSLQGDLKAFSRVKKKGLPDRYRLFFKVFPEEKRIVILWLGYPRKDGDKRDCYAVFSQRVKRGDFPDSFESLTNGLLDR
jgi:toxin YhaV